MAEGFHSGLLHLEAIDLSREYLIVHILEINLFELRTISSSPLVWIQSQITGDGSAPKTGRARVIVHSIQLYY